MTEQEKTISILYQALSEINRIGTHYPPHWETFSQAEREQWPPVQTKEAKIAAQALLKASTEAP